MSTKRGLTLLIALALAALTAGPALAIDVCGNGVCCTWCIPKETPQNCHADCYCPFTDMGEAEQSSDENMVELDSSEPPAEADASVEPPAEETREAATE